MSSKLSQSCRTPPPPRHAARPPSWIIFKNGVPVGASASNGILRVAGCAYKRYGREGVELRRGNECTAKQVQKALHENNRRGYGSAIRRRVEI